MIKRLEKVVKAIMQDANRMGIDITALWVREYNLHLMVFGTVDAEQQDMLEFRQRIREVTDDFDTYKELTGMRGAYVNFFRCKKDDKIVKLFLNKVKMEKEDCVDLSMYATE